MNYRVKFRNFENMNFKTNRCCEFSTCVCWNFYELFRRQNSLKLLNKFEKFVNGCGNMSLCVCVGIFVACTLTTVMALVVFWRKSNTVFALQKCEERDIDDEVIITRGQSNLTKSASRGAHSPVRGHPRGSKFVPLNSWGRGSY